MKTTLRVSLYIAFQTVIMLLFNRKLSNSFRIERVLKTSFNEFSRFGSNFRSFTGKQVDRSVHHKEKQRLYADPSSSSSSSSSGNSRRSNDDNNSDAASSSDAIKKVRKLLPKKLKSTTNENIVSSSPVSKSKNVDRDNSLMNDITNEMLKRNVNRSSPISTPPSSSSPSSSSSSSPPNAYINDISAEIKSSGKAKKNRVVKREVYPHNPDWVTVHLGTAEDIQREEMKDRIEDAKRWVNKQLTDEESAILNRAMGNKNILYF